MENSIISYEILFNKNYCEDEIKNEIGNLFEKFINNYDEDVIENFFKNFVIKLPNIDKISNKLEIILNAKKYQKKIIELFKIENINIENIKSNVNEVEILGKKRMNYIKNLNNNYNPKDNIKIKTINHYFKPQPKLNDNKILSFRGAKNLIESKKIEVINSNSNLNSISTSCSSSTIGKDNINQLLYCDLFKKVSSFTNENSINNSNISTPNISKNNIFTFKNSNQISSFNQNSLNSLSNFSECSQYNGINSRLGNSNIFEKIKKSKSQKKRKKNKNSKLEKATSMLLKEGNFNQDIINLNCKKKSKEEEIKLKKTKEIKEFISDKFYLDENEGQNKENLENIKTPKKKNKNFSFSQQEILAYKTPEKLSKKKKIYDLTEKENEEKKIKMNSYLLFSQLKSSI